MHHVMHSTKLASFIIVKQVFQYAEPLSRPDVIHHMRIIMRQIMNMMTHCDTPTRSLFFKLSLVQSILCVQLWSQKITELSKPPSPKIPPFCITPPKE